MKPWVWLSQRLRAAATRLWRPLLRRAAAAAALLVFCCFCVYLHLRSLPEKLTVQQLLHQHLHRQARDAISGICSSVGALRAPLLDLLGITGALLLDLSSLFLLWVKFVYPVVAPVVAKAIRVYMQLQPQQQLLIAAAAATVPLFYLLRVSEKLRRARAAVVSFYVSLTSYVAAGAPIVVTVLLHCSCCLLLGASSVSHYLSALWLPVPLLGTAIFGATNLDVFKGLSFAAIAAHDSQAATAATPDDEAAAAAATAAARTERRLRSLRSLTCWLMLWFLQGKHLRGA